MVVNVDKLRGLIVERQTTQEAVAESLGMDRTTFFRKIKNGGLGFTVGDIHGMVDYLHMTTEEAVAIFFAS